MEVLIEYIVIEVRLELFSSHLSSLLIARPYQKEFQNMADNTADLAESPLSVYSDSIPKH